MISRPPEKVMSAISSLRSNEQFRILHKYLQESLDQMDIDSRRIQEEHRVRWYQGGSQALEDLLSFIESAKNFRR